MSVIFLLITIGLIFSGCFLAAFFWAVGNGQYDDDYTPSIRILFDDKPSTSSTKDLSHTEIETKTATRINIVTED